MASQDQGIEKRQLEKGNHTRLVLISRNKI
jgi:hypothetical protein